MPPLFADLALARRLERAEGHANAMFVEARARVAPDSGSTWMECGGAYAMFDGPDSPLTQTFGLGLFEDATPRILDRIEQFYAERNTPEVFHETSPLAGLGLVALLHGRGYRPMEFTSVLYRGVEAVTQPPDPAIRVRRVDPASEEGAVWADVAARGWAPEQPDLLDFLRGMGKVIAAKQDAVCFLAEIDGEPGAAGSLNFHDGVAHFSGASTIPAMRRRGLQYALLAARMECALERGCGLALMGALPGSASQRNAERHGFRIAYTRIKWASKTPGRSR